MPPGDWHIWLILAGRGWGKTRTGAEVIREWVNSGKCKRLHIVARTAADARDTMIQGESGILACCQFDIGNVPTYLPSRRLIQWPNGGQALIFSAEEPDQLRGPQCDGWWSDEAASWQRCIEVWDNLQMGARLGSWVQGVVTTTPRPIPLLKQLLKQDGVHVTRGSTYDNLDNLAGSIRQSILDRYEGTRLGRQELHAEVLDDNPAALWARSTIDNLRVKIGDTPQFYRVVVAVDPAATDNPDSDETGIVVAALGSDNHGYVLADLSRRMSPDQWGQAAVAAYDEWQADRVVYETNQGGDMVAHVLRSVRRDLPIKGVHATRGKMLRAEPVAARYEQGHVHHVGTLPQLEDQMCDWDPTAGYSPDRVDALVWALTELMGRPAIMGLDRRAMGI